MTLFGKKKEKPVIKKRIPEKMSEKSSPARNVEKASHGSVLLQPRITEKATERAANANAYVFEVATSATKKDIKEAVSAVYKVTPLKVSTVKIVSKRVFVRGKKGRTAGGKKAYVYLKQGEKIEFV